MTKCNNLLTNCFAALALCLYCYSCMPPQEEEPMDLFISDSPDTGNINVVIPDTTIAGSEPASIEPLAYHNTTEKRIDVKNIKPQQVVDYARSLLGVPYKYASMDPAQGFDCSGFISYVFNHFNIAVPRSSVDFTNIPVAVSEQQSKPGDLILFTGTDSTVRIVGHMGIVTENSDSTGIQFIHASSGKANAVTISPLQGYYRGRFVKLIRIF